MDNGFHTAGVALAIFVAVMLLQGLGAVLASWWLDRTLGPEPVPADPEAGWPTRHEL